MTETLIKSAARRPLWALARPSVVALFALVLGYGGGLWLNVLHHAEGGVERNEPPMLLHWLRDSTLALPLVLAAVWVGVIAARSLIARAGEERRTLAALTMGATIAVLVSAATAAGGPAHASLFGAVHGGHELPLGLHLLRDGLLALVVQLPLAAGVALALAPSRPWAEPRVSHWLRPVSLGQTRLVKVAVCFVLFAPTAVFLQTTGTQVADAGAAGAPCASSSPVKSFDVSAINVNIPLNRFGDHDPNGKMYVLDSQIDAVRAQESSRKLTRGLRDDAIQPLVIRANQGDCVEIKFTNRAGGEFGMHIDGLAFDAGSSGDAVGNNPASAVGNGETRTYRFWVPRDAEAEGAHYIRPGPGHRNAVQHGLFGALAVQPEGSKYLDLDTGKEIESGWEASIVPGNGKKAFREYVQIYHEIGNENTRLPTAGGEELPMVDPHTTAYRPGSRAINYRSEPFLHRLDKSSNKKALAYASYPFGDPVTPVPRGYVGDPTKHRIVHGGSEMFHVFHMHGGGIRWRFNPTSDSTFDYQDTGLRKHPVEQSPSHRLDSQSFGPGESYTLEIEGGAGGVQQGAGEFLMHCHISEHYLSGMWNFWRVYDTRKPDLQPLPDRAAPPSSVDSAGLIGRTMPDGTTITRENLDEWVRPQLPPQGVRANAEDATVWNYSKDGDTFLGEPEDTSSWQGLGQPGDKSGLEGHPNLYPGDEVVGNRPKILFNPENGRPAFPLLRTQVAMRPPFSPNGHSGAPYLGERGGAAKQSSVDPWAGRNDGICPEGAPVRKFNVVALNVDVPVTKTAKDTTGAIFVLAENVQKVLNGDMPAEPLAIRGNVGDCIAVTLTSKLSDAWDFSGFSKTNMHIHHVQFDTQASDGVISGMSFEQSIRPYAAEDPTLVNAVNPGARTLRLSSVSKFKPGVGIAVGQGTDDIEVHEVESVDAGAGTVTLKKALAQSHAAGHHAGVEFVQYRWYPDVNLDNVFWHDHVDGIHGWNRGLVGQFIVEPKGSTYHDPKTGAEVKSGTYVDIRTNNPLAPGSVDGSFREMALWTIDENPVTDSTINLRAEPWANRLAANGDPSTLFSSWAHGDPHTPLPKAYRGDPFVVRTINVGPAMDTLRFDGHRFLLDQRQRDASGKPEGIQTDALHYGVSEKFTAILQGGAGGTSQRAGDYLYHNGVGRRFRQGAWGILRVLPRQVGELQTLPGTSVPAGGTLPSGRSARPPSAGTPGDPCPGNGPQRSFNVSAVSLPGAVVGRQMAYVPTADAAAVKSGAKAAQPLVLHVAAGECVDVRFTNDLDRPATGTAPRASFHVAKLDRDVASSGVNVGYNPEQTVEIGESRTYRYYADTEKIGSAIVSDFGGNDTGKKGLYGAVVVAPSGATFADPASGEARDVGTAVDVHVPGGESYRDFSMIMADDDPIIGGMFTPYKEAVEAQSFVNYGSQGSRGDGATAFSSRTHGDPAKDLVMQAYAGDPVRVHAINAPGSEQSQTFSMGGQSFGLDPRVPRSQEISTRGVGPFQAYDLALTGGAGGRARTVGDFFYGSLRRPFTEAGMWGLMRVISDQGCPIKPLPGRDCLADASLITDQPTSPAADSGAGRPNNSGPGSANSGPSRRRPAPTVLGLRFPKRITTRTLSKKGLTISARVPASARRVRLRLHRVSGKRQIAAGELIRTIKRGGRVRITWKTRSVRRLKPALYRLRVDAGPRRGKFLQGGADVRFRVIVRR